MARSTKKSITVPNPVREGLIAQLKDGTLDYPSENSAWIGLARYQLLIGKPHPVTAAIARMHSEDQDVIDDFLLDVAQRGLTLRGQLLSRMIHQALDGSSGPTEQEISGMLPQELLRMAKEWRKNPEKVVAELGRNTQK